MADPSSTITTWAVFSAIGGSIVGGTISAIVAFITQYRNLKEAKKQRDEDRFERRKALAFSLFIKMSKVTSNINTLRKYIAEPVAQAKIEGETGNFWRFVLPPANIFARINFTPDETAVVLSINSSLFNKLMRWDGIHNGMLDAFELYRTQRYKLTDTLSAEMTGLLGTSTLTEAEMAQAAPRMAELDSLVSQLEEQTHSDTLASWALFEEPF
jgi:hypothetical protein